MEHPDVAERMREEVLRVCEGRQSISFADVKKMKYGELRISSRILVLSLIFLQLKQF
jgi:Cytochrome P450